MLRKTRSNASSPAWVHIATVAPIVHFCVANSIPIRAYFHKHHLPHFDSENAAIVVPLQRCTNLINDLAGREGIDNIGKEVVHHATATQLRWQLTDSGAFTLLMALREFSERLRSLSSTRFHIEEIGQSVRYYRTEEKGVRDDECHAGLYFIESLLQLIRSYVGEGWTPPRIGAPYESAYQSDISKWFPHSAVEFTEGSWFIEIDRTLLGSKKIECWQHADANSQELDHQLEPVYSSSTTEALIRVIKSYLPHEFLSVEELAELFGIKTRTLQRRLAAEGTSYSSLASIARLSWAKDRLNNSGEKVIEIGLSAGYASHACFSRAFKQYSGVTPTEHRAHRLHTNA